MSPDTSADDPGRACALPPAGAGTGLATGTALLSLAELVAWGEDFGRSVRAPCIVALDGDLGAGKTTLVQAIARGYGVTASVTSPTFALVHEYGGGGTTVYHLDLYRLHDARELLYIGWNEIVERDALVLIEWPDRAGAALPTTAIHLALAHVPNDHEHRLLTRR